MERHTRIHMQAHMYKHTCTEHATKQIPRVLFGISLADTVPHQNVAKSDVFRKEAKRKADVCPQRSPISQVGCSSGSDQCGFSRPLLPRL